MKMQTRNSKKDYDDSKYNFTEETRKSTFKKDKKDKLSKKNKNINRELKRYYDDEVE